MILKEYRKSYLALELKAGKKWLEGSPHILSDADGSLRPVAGIAVARSFYECGSKNRPVIMGNPEVIGSSAGLVPRNALVISNRASPRVVGCSEPIEKKERVELDYVSWTATGTTQQTQSPSLLPREIDLLIPSK